MASINFGEVLDGLPEEPAEFTLPGVYLMNVGYVKFTTSSNGNPMYVIQLVSAEGPTQHRSVKYHVVFGQDANSQRFFFKKLFDLGVTPEEVKQYSDSEHLAGRLMRVGPVRAQLKARTWNEETVPDVVWVRKLNQPQVVPGTPVMAG